jgi:magnesium transporter
LGKGQFRPPGELCHLDGVTYYPTKVTVMDYDGQSLTEKEVTDLEECIDLVRRPTTTWVNVTGLRDLKTLQRLGEIFEIHPLALEDIVNTRQRPKLDDYGSSFFIIMRKLKSGEAGEITTQQVSIILGERYILTFHETGDDPFDGVRQRIRQGRVRIRNSGPDYLAYALLDAIVDSYFPVLDRYALRIEALEDQATKEPTQETVEKIQDLKREIIHISQLAWSIRELITQLSKLEDVLISKDTLVYLRDVQDHTLRVQDLLETYRELGEGLYKIYVSGLNIRTNEVIRVLTVISTIFLPLNFIASIYGMNFDGMPELKWAGGYYWCMAAMVGIAAGMILWFRKRRWL